MLQLWYATLLFEDLLLTQTRIIANLILLMVNTLPSSLRGSVSI